MKPVFTSPLSELVDQQRVIVEYRFIVFVIRFIFQLVIRERHGSGSAP